MQILILVDHIERILSRYKTIIFLIISMFIVEALISITNDISSIKQEVKAIEHNTTDIN